MRKIFSLLLLVSFFSCQQNKKEPHVFHSLNDGLLFNEDSVNTFLSAVSQAQADSSKRLFLSAVDLFKNQKKAKAGIALFLQSLSLFPNASAYYELGEAYLESGKPDLALSSFKMAEKLEYAPLSYVLFKQACCYAEMGEVEEVYDYVSFAVENGFVDRNKLFNDAHFKHLKNDPQLVDVYNEAMSGNGEADAILWHGYLREFRNARFPLSIDSGTFRNLKNPVYISYSYEKFVTEMRDNQFSRDVGNEFFYFAKVAEKKDFTVLIYGCQSYEWEGAPVYYYLVSFDKKGKLLDKKVIAGAMTFDDPFKEFTMEKDLSFSVKEYRNTYEKSVEEEGYENNPISKRDLVATKNYHFTDEGKMIELSGL